ncbi:FAD/NAD(P)-binding protein [Coxiella endosymbiont of Ornithodoros maritimus]|uniref:FAD/NAD(P)-binding protein n=1 Tax=Coxiella endosymbiont of Ornithodoros maritimus TaxID=1656172 RepID=UPI0022646583|nr:FAD/NAD(P)-binding protein [Coxiella endosymbiont of Ornithodoros maritimus]
MFTLVVSIRPGLPSSPEEDRYILNLLVSAMHAGFEDQSRFAKWFSTNYPNITTPFPPRTYFGHYLTDLSLFARAIPTTGHHSKIFY